MLFETTKHIDSPAQRVWDVLIDVDRWPEWTPTIDRVERIDKGPFQVGSRTTIRQPKLPRATWKVTELQNGHSFTWVASGPGRKTIAQHSVVPDASGCTVTLSLEQTGVVGVLAARIWRRLTQRYIELEAESLERRVTRTPTA